ncbi:MAG: hypothetical protein ACD_75C00331G0006 [uncultured bacterium]|nr:MAG: hypothetical protein ACD_75C00331G0006 [uncultured bacterium]
MFHNIFRQLENSFDAYNAPMKKIRIAFNANAGQVRSIDNCLLTLRRIDQFNEYCSQFGSNCFLRLSA